MKPMTVVRTLALAATLTAATGAFAQAPAGSTGVCKDGSYTSADTRKGACAGHGGVKTWTGTKKTATTTKADTAAPATKAAPAMAAPAMAAPAAAGAMAAPAAKAPTAMAPATPTKTAQKSAEMPKEAAPGGGPGKVWVNTSSKVYHCSGDEWYGKTKEGAYMSEADAKAKGNHAANGKACG